MKKTSWKINVETAGGICTTYYAATPTFVAEKTVDGSQPGPESTSYRVAFYCDNEPMLDNWTDEWIESGEAGPAPEGMLWKEVTEEKLGRLLQAAYELV